MSSRIIVGRIAEAYDRMLKNHARGRLLDLGCGDAPLYGFYRDLVNEAICADWPKSYHRNATLDLELDVTSELPFPDCAFDTVLLTDVLEHIPNPELVIARVARVLRVGGKVLIGVPFFYPIHEEPYDYYRYTEFALRRFAMNAGLLVVELAPYGGVPEIMADLTAKTLAAMRLSTLVRLCVSLSSFLLRTSLVQRLSRATAADMPFGYVAVFEKPCGE